MLPSPSDILKKAERLYPRFLRSTVDGETFFPCAISFRKVGAADAFDRVRREVESLVNGSRERQGTGYAVEMEGVNTRRYGLQYLPARIAFESEKDFLSFLGKEPEVEQLRADLALIDARMPALSRWARQNLRHVIDHAGGWSNLLAVCRYFTGHPRPDLYIRQLPIPVHTKFVEEHYAILRRLLDEVLPPETIDAQASRFEQRYGLRYDEPLIRLRILDAELQATIGMPMSDVSIPLREIDRLDLDGATVVITENKMSFLTLPPIPDGVGVLGMGMAVGLLRHARWLGSCRILYWGDIDAHGFEILSKLRSIYPGTESLMMDPSTLGAHIDRIGYGAPYTQRPPLSLDPSELAVFHRVAERNERLEQERLEQDYVDDRIRLALVQETPANNA